MKIPDRLEQKLNIDRAMSAAVNGAITQFEPWIKDNKLPFFPDYTDHGIDHIEQVLATASSLIHDDAWPIMTPQDSGMLVLACLLHECAMHLSADGFIALVSDKSDQLINGLDKIPWPQLWQDYLFSAKRWDDRTLIDIFGDASPVRVPPLDAIRMTKRDRLLIGEFLRRHHPRLAHEVAVFGLPVWNGRILLLSGLEADLADLVGLIARSHGMALRAVFPYMDEREFDKHEYRGIHAIFLMTLVRIADYLQIQSERAPEKMLQIKTIRSPLSLREHLIHLSVIGVHNKHIDPEAIVIHAKPQDVRTFLRLKEWLTAIQSELDALWAVLGETYSPVKLNQLGLTIRRVRSNLDDVQTFAGNVAYIPKRVEFDVARAEILKLLVGPLYGDKPEVGIRELMQNAVDAVRELWDFQKQQPKFKDVEVLEQEGDVEVWIDEPDENGIAWLSVSDKGIGMTEEVITDYFLKVGASFRQSATWTKQHEISGDQLEEGAIKSRIIRTGRFGVGALATYPLGHEIDVATRHVTAKSGLRFTTKLDSEAIELRHDPLLKVGTTIRIPLNQHIYTDFVEYDNKGTNWDWYCFSNPTVSRLMGRERRKLPQAVTVPNVDENLPLGWYTIHHHNFQCVSCSYVYENTLVCNGIKIKSEDYFPLRDSTRSGRDMLNIKYPLISIFDPDGNLELNLTRSEINIDAPIRSIYTKSRLQYLIAFLLQCTPREISSLDLPPKHIVDPSHSNSIKLWPWFYTRKGLAPAEPNIIINANVRTCLVLPSIAQRSLFSNLVKTHHDAIFRITTNEFHSYFQKLNGYAELILEGFVNELFKMALNGKAYALNQLGTRLITTRSCADSILEYFQNKHRLQPNYGGYPNRKLPEIRDESTTGKWASLIVGSPPPTKITDEWLESLPVSNSKNDLPPMVGEWFLSDEQPEIEPAGLALEWKEIIREPVIPYDLKERREKLAHAYEILAPYLENMEQPEDV